MPASRPRSHRSPGGRWRQRPSSVLRPAVLLPHGQRTGGIELTAGHVEMVMPGDVATVAFTIALNEARYIALEADTRFAIREGATARCGGRRDQPSARLRASRRRAATALRIQAYSARYFPRPDHRTPAACAPMCAKCTFEPLLRLFDHAGSQRAARITSDARPMPYGSARSRRVLAPLVMIVKDEGDHVVEAGRRSDCRAGPFAATRWKRRSSCGNWRITSLARPGHAIASLGFNQPTDLAPDRSTSPRPPNKPLASISKVRTLPRAPGRRRHRRRRAASLRVAPSPPGRAQREPIKECAYSTVLAPKVRASSAYEESASGIQCRPRRPFRKRCSTSSPSDSVSARPK